MSDGSVRWGVLSTATINRKVVPATQAAARCEVVAIGSRDRSRAEAAASEFGVARAYGSYEEVLSDPDVDAIYNPLPNDLHERWTIQAARAGKHVLCEKPLAMRVAEAERMVAACRDEGVLLMEAFMYRHNPQTRRLVELVRDGAVGRLRLVRSAFSFAEADPANVRLTTALDGGALMDVGCYCVSGSRLIAGEPQQVAAEQLTGGDGVDIVFAATMRFADDVLGQFDAGLALDTRDALEVVGDEGTLFLDDPWHCLDPVIQLYRDGERELIEVEVVNSYRLEAENMSAAIRGEAPLLLGRADAVGQARAIEALYEAADTGGPVTLS